MVAGVIINDKDHIKYRSGSMSVSRVSGNILLEKFFIKCRYMRSLSKLTIN